MKIVLLGSGNVASHLGKALSTAKHTILQVWSRQLEHAQSLAADVQAEAIDQLDQLHPHADLYILSVVDDAIIPVLSKLKAFTAPIVHTSGSTPMESIAPYATRFGVFYPLQTFSKQVDLSLATTPILIEASEASLAEILKDLAASISSHVEYCSSEQRLNLHVAAVFACNFTNHLYAISQQLLAEKQLDFALIRPLLLETAQKAMTHLPTTIQTGPAIRRDELTLDRHRRALETNAEWRAIYELLTKSIQHNKA